MTRDQGSFAFVEDIVPELVKIGFAGNDLYLPIAAIKQIVLYHGVAGGHRCPAIPDLDGFSAWPSFGRSWTKMIVVDFVIMNIIMLKEIKGKQQ